MNQHFAIFALVWVFLVLTGCGSRGTRDDVTRNDAHKSNDDPRILVGDGVGDPTDLPEGIAYVPNRDENSPPRVDRQPHMSTDNAEITAVRAKFRKEQTRRFQAALQRIREGGWLFLEQKQALSGQRDKAVTLLRMMARDESQPATSRATAAYALAMLDDPDGESLLFDFLDSNSAELRKSALKSLGEWNLEVDCTTPDRAERIMALLDDDDPDVVLQAAELCSYRRIPGAEEALAAVLQKNKAVDKRKIANELCDVVNSPKSVDVLLAHYFPTETDEYRQWTGFGLRRLIGHENSQISEPIGAALRKFLLQFTGKQRYDQSWVADFARVATEQDLRLLHDIQHNATDPVSRGYALQGIARLQPEKSVDLAIEYLRSELHPEAAIDELVQHAHMEDGPRSIDALNSWRVRCDRQFSLNVAKLLLEEFGAAGRTEVESRIRDFDTHAQMWIKWKLDGIDLMEALNELYSAKIISNDPSKLVETMRAQRRASATRYGGNSEIDVTDPSELVGALTAEGIVVTFDAETGMLPCEHHQLVFDFAQASAGRFHPEAAVQQWHQKDGDDLQAPYTVQFVFQDRLFTFGAENYGDWYDVNAVLNALNFALAKVDCDERFIPLESDGQIAMFVFAEPATFIPLARKLGLPLSEDAAEAMRKGKEFEQRVRDTLRE